MTRFARLLGVVVLTLAVAVPWAARPAAAIAHGTTARAGDYRFSVLLSMTGLPAEGGGTRDSSCSGALIGPRWVITAGHCFRDAAGHRVSRTVAARTTATVGGATIQVIGAHQADDADVALAELAEPVAGVTPIRLDTAPPEPGEVLRLTGFGLLSDGGRAADRMQTGQFTVDSVGGTEIETSGRAPHRDTSPCLHDSGGPYFHEEPDGTAVLAAVVSSGPPCPHTGPDVSARVDNLRDWITSTITSPRPDAGLLLGVAGVAALIAIGVIGWRWAKR